MVAARPPILSFNAGELSPLLDGRIDFNKYAAGCRRLENMVALEQGPAARRPGFIYVRAPKDQSERVWFDRFVFSDTDAYVLELGDLYMRLFAQGGQVESSPGVPLEVVTPWTLADLTTSEGTIGVQSAQNFDRQWFVGGSHLPQILQRFAATNWTLTPFDPEDGPFNDPNTDEALTVYASAATGSVTLTASDDLFVAGQIGSLIRLSSVSPSEVQPWKAGESVTANTTIRREESRVYIARSTATTGATRLVHERGMGSDGVVTWEYLHAGSGWARITSVTNATTAVATVVQRFPAEVVGSGNATDIWEMGAFNSVDGYPSAVTFFNKRLVFARGPHIWMSRADDFFSFQDKTGGEPLDDDAITLTLSGEVGTSIKWMRGGKTLLVGTETGEVEIGSQTTSEPFGPANIAIRPQTSYGSRQLASISAHDRVLFVQRAGQHLFELGYSYETDAQAAIDLSSLASHISQPGIVDMAWQQPERVLWLGLGDGALAGVTYMPEQEVVAWHYHPLAEHVTVETVESIPRGDGTGDEVWACLAYQNGGDVRRWICRMSRRWAYADRRGNGGTDRTDAWFVDAGLAYDGAPATTIDGLEHLEGLEVVVLTDGAEHPSRTVEDGEIALDRAASKVTAGLDMTSLLMPMRIEAGAAGGVAQAQTKRVHRLGIRLLESRNVEMGASLALMDRIDRRDSDTPMGQPQPLTTADVIQPFPGDFETEGDVILRMRGPLPATITALWPSLVTNER